MEKQKSVTIKETLFMDLVKYFLVNVREDEDRIRYDWNCRKNWMFW